MAHPTNIPRQKVSQGSYSAFVPAPLPPELEWTPRLIGALSDADRLVGRLAGEDGRLPNPHILIRPFVQRELFYRARLKAHRPRWVSYLPLRRERSWIAVPKIFGKLAITQWLLSTGSLASRTIPLRQARPGVAGKTHDGRPGGMKLRPDVFGRFRIGLASLAARSQLLPTSRPRRERSSRVLRPGKSSCMNRPSRLS